MRIWACRMTDLAVSVLRRYYTGFASVFCALVLTGPAVAKSPAFVLADLCFAFQQSGDHDTFDGWKKATCPTYLKCAAGSRVYAGRNALDGVKVVARHVADNVEGHGMTSCTITGTQYLDKAMFDRDARHWNKEALATKRIFHLDEAFLAGCGVGRQPFVFLLNVDVLPVLRSLRAQNMWPSCVEETS